MESTKYFRNRRKINYNKRGNNNKFFIENTVIFVNIWKFNIICA